MSWIKRAWRGEERLWKVFWVYGVLLAAGLSIAAFIAKILLGPVGYIVLAVVRIAYSIWLLVAQWRCAFNVEWTFWGYIARIQAIVILIAVPLAIVGGVLDLTGASECSKELKTYNTYGGTDIEGFKKSCVQEPNKYKQRCEQNLRDNAVKIGNNPDLYVVLNQDYIQKCVESYVAQDAAGKK